MPIQTSLIKPASAWRILILLVLAGFIVPLCGPIVHETDQTSLLYGALKISETGELAGRFYNYDKQYGAYWLLALVFKVLNIQGADALVFTGNILCSAILFCGLWVIGRFIVSWDQFVFMGCILLSPSLLMHSPFLATNYFSAALLCAQLAAMRANSGLRYLAPVFAFYAVACRADAVLLQPLLFWSVTPQWRISALFRLPLLWLTAAFCILALVIGKWIDVKPSPFFIPVFEGKVVLAYTIFGLGSVVLLLVFTFFAFCSALIRHKERRIFLLWGMAFCFLPFLFYSVQMYSTRHWTISLFGLAFLYCSENGMTIMREAFKRIGRSPIFVLLAIAAVLPLFAGIRMPVFPKATLTLTHPTLFPTTDGFQPMGAYLARAWGWDRTHRLIPDYNQAIWLAAKATDFVSPGDGVPLIGASPLVSIVHLAVAVQKKRVRYATIGELEKTGFAYADCRYLRKGILSFDGGIQNSRDIERAYAMFTVSPVIDGESIEMLVPGENDRARMLGILRERFSYNDFGIREGVFSDGLGRTLDLPDISGRQLVILSDDAVSLTLPDGSGRSSGAVPVGGWNILEIPSGGEGTYKLDGKRNGQRYVIALSRLPSYMSRKNYKSTDE